jgi:GT2 family glycosyltransferase
VSAPTVAVVIPTHDRRESLLRCLDALERQTRPPDEVIVVDDAGRDGLAAAVEARRGDLPVLVVRRATNGGPAAARNTGLAAVTTEVVALTDSDCEPAPGWLAAGLAALADPSVAVVQGRTAPARPVDPTRWDYTQDINRLTGLYEACNLFVRAADLRAVGGFPEHVRGFGEDVVTGWRLLRRGGRPAFCAEAVVVHEVRTPAFGWYLRWARLYERWPLVVREVPEVRGALLWHRWFLRRADAEVALGLVALAAAATTRRPVLAAAALPWLARRAPRRLTRAALVETGRHLAFDAVTVASCAEGSVRHRRLVL